MKMTLTVMVESVRASKTDARKFYVDFVFMGGSASFLVNSEEVSRYQGKVGQQMDVSITVRPRSVVIYERPVTLFEPVAIMPEVPGRYQKPV